MKSSTIAIITAAILLGGGYMIYRKAAAPKKVHLTKEAAIAVIVSAKEHSNAAFLATMDEGFLKAWANGVVGNIEVFKYDGKYYHTKGGTSVK